MFLLLRAINGKVQLLRRKSAFPLAGSALLLCSFAARADDITWLPATGAWEVGTNWSSGTAPSAADKAFVNSGTVAIGSAGGSASSLILGNVTGTNPTLTLASGLFTTSTGTIATATGSRVSATVNSGTWINSGLLTIGATGTATLTINGGMVRTGTLRLSDLANSRGTVRVDGGLIETSQVVAGSGVGSEIFVSGGTLRAMANQANFFSGTKAAWSTIGFYGMSLDTNGYDIGMRSHSGNGGLTKMGQGTLSVTGTNSWVGTTVRSGTMILNGRLDNWSSIFTVGGYNGDVATFRLDGGSISTGHTYIGYRGGATGTATLNDGRWINSSDLIVGYASGFGTPDSQGTLIINGGVMSAADAYIGNENGVVGRVTLNNGSFTPGDLTIGRYGQGTFIMNGGTTSNMSAVLGYNQYSSGTATVNGGIWTASLSIGLIGSGVLNVNGGLVASSGMRLAAGYSASAAINLSGGILRTGQIYKELGTASLFFNGGTLQASANQSNYLKDFAPGTVRISSGGANIDTDGYAIGISSVISGSGPLNKLGTGSLVLSASNTYTGGSNVVSGTLAINHSQGAGTGTVTVQDGAALVVSGSAASFSNRVVLAGGEYQRALAAGTSLAGQFQLSSHFAGGAADTSATLLAGTTSTTATLQADFSGTSSATNDIWRVSDVLSLTGVPEIDPLTGKTDLFVLQLSAVTEDSEIFLAWRDPDTNAWVNATQGNIDNNSLFASPYSGSFADFQAAHGTDLSQYIGAWGTTSADGITSTWAVLNHNSDFAIIPEPAAAGLVAAGILSLAARRRRRVG
jgi:autotransporter-associated beta strand protein